MQPENQSDLFNKNLTIDHTSKQHIQSMASWAMVIVVIAVIGYAVSLFQSLTASPATVSTSEGFDLGFASKSNTATAIIGILVGLLVNYFLYRFATQAKKAVTGLDQAQLNGSFNNLKIYFLIASIIGIIVFLVVILVLVVLATGSKP